MRGGCVLMAGDISRSWSIAAKLVSSSCGVVRSVSVAGNPVSLGVDDQLAVLLGERTRRERLEQIEDSLGRAAEPDALRRTNDRAVHEDRVARHGVQQCLVGDVRRGEPQLLGRGTLDPECLAHRDPGGGEQRQKLRARPALLQIVDYGRLVSSRLDDAEHVAGRATVGIVVDDDREGTHAGNLSRVRFAMATRLSITGTSTSTPTTVASAAPEFSPKSPIATATASSKKFDVPISAQGAATRWGTAHS